MMEESDERGDSIHTDGSSHAGAGRVKNSMHSDGKGGEDDDDTGSDYQDINTSHHSGRLMPSSCTPSRIVKQGILSKKARAKFIRPWALRKVVLDEEYRLFYYEGNSVKGVINLIGTGVRHVKPDQADGRNFAFEVVNINDIKTARSKASSLLLAAGSQTEADEWVEAIHSLVRKVNRSQTSMEYESFEAVAKANLANPIDLKKLKQQRKLRSQEEAEDEGEDEFEDQPLNT